MRRQLSDKQRGTTMSFKLVFKVAIRFTLLLMLTAGLAPASFAAASHPLDALDATEIAASTAILRANGHIDDATPILSLTLEPPFKGEVLAWEPGKEISRNARAVVRREGVNREFVIDLNANNIATVEEIPGPGQPPRGPARR